jgi:hypothetical protein
METRAEQGARPVATDGVAVFRSERTTDTYQSTGTEKLPGRGVVKMSSPMGQAALEGAAVNASAGPV